MKFLACTDMHENREALKALVKRASESDIDFVVCMGDISSFGNGLRTVLKAFSDLEKTFYVVPGNHEEGRDFEGIVKDFPHCINLHLKAASIKEYVFLGYGGGGFTMKDANFRKIARQWYGKFNGKKIVLLTHQPPFGTKLDRLGDRHVGNVDFHDFILRIKPKLAISGHLHETVGEMDTLGETKLINPGWDGMVIELN
ncbi:metallophosphoesterase [Candidatus Woesearchaeota archaeon]|nr:metallophosphoesterase [Candidatus Woesearchaeota archaeon]